MSRKITVKCFCASDGIYNRNAIKNPPSAIRQKAEGIYSVCRKSLFFQKVLVLNPYKNALWALHPAKPLGVLSRHPCRKPKPLPLGERQCMLGWLCIVQSLWAYTPGVRAGAECGAVALTKQGRACCQSHTVAMQGSIKTATQSRCTMQRHKWLSMHRCSDTNDWQPALGLRPKPHF